MRRCSSIAGALAIAALAVPAAASAQYTAPPPDPGFHYIFDGTPTGSDASFDKWAFAAGTAAQSRPASEGGQGQATLDPVEGSFLVGASPFGAYWYPVRTFGDAVFRIQYTVQNTPTSTRNGGVMIRFPEVRYTGANTNAVLAQKPTGFNYDVCGGALPVCGRTTPAASTTYSWPGASGPFPPPGTYSGAYCARSGTEDVSNLAGNGPLTVNGNANNHQHWGMVYCGHEIQINETLTGTGELGGSDPIKTGSVYGFRNLNAKQSGTNERLVKGVWHEMEIRTIGQQFTVLVDGKMINQFDNSIPKIASRSGDPGTMARQFARGYLGLQTHGGNDRISYREIQVKDIPAGDIPVNTTPPTVTGTGSQGLPLTCNQGEWNAPAGTSYFVKWYRSNKILPTNPRLRAPSQLDYWNETTPSEPQYGNQDLTWLDSQVIGEGPTYTPTAADVGKALHCAVNADNDGATVWKTAAAPEIFPAVQVPVGGSVAPTLNLSVGTTSFGTLTPGVAKTYEATANATVTSTAGDAALSVSDPGHLTNGAFTLPEPLQVTLGKSAWTGPTSGEIVPITFKQVVKATDALRTGNYSKTLTFTLSTTQP